MDHYLDIKILPDPEFTTAVLMNALYNKLHRALVQLNTQSIGVSFPKLDEEKMLLGSVLRLHSTEAELKHLMSQNWITGFRDHASFSKINKIPGQVMYRQVMRIQVKSSPERIRRRLIKRKGVTELEAQKLIPDTKAQKTCLPYLIVKSSSTSQRFRLFVKHNPAAGLIEGIFSAYGLSQKATVPWF